MPKEQTPKTENEIVLQPFELSEDLDVEVSLFDSLSEKGLLEEEQTSDLKDAFRSAVRSQLETLIESKINPHYEEQLVEAVNNQREELSEDLSNYMDMVVEEFVQENEEKLVASETAKQDRTLVEGLVNLLKESYVEVPEGRQDLVESLSNDLQATNKELAESEDMVMKLRSKYNGLICESKFDKATQGLTVTERDKLMNLCEDLSVENPDEFGRKVEFYRDNLLGTPRKSKDLTEDENVPSGDTVTSIEEEDSNAPEGATWLQEALSINSTLSKQKNSKNKSAAA